MTFDIFKSIIIILISIICSASIVRASVRHKATMFEAGMAFFAMGYGIISMFSQGISGLFDIFN